MGLGSSGANIMSLPPDMLRTIMQLVQSGQWGTPQGFEQLFAGPNPAGGGAMKAGRNQYMREHPQSDPFGWSEFTAGTDFDAFSKPRPLTVDELNAAHPGKNYKSNVEGYSHDLSLEDVQFLRDHQNEFSYLKGQKFLDLLPPSIDKEGLKAFAAAPLSAYNKFMDQPGIGGAHREMTQPMSRDEAQLAAAEGLGYGAKGLLQKNKGALGVNDRINTANALQTLKSAGWDESMGYGPQGNLSDKMNQLLFAVAPDYDKSKIPIPEKDPRLSQVYDPFGGMQSAIARDAYVNDTLGGGFYGGVLPEADDQTWGIGDMQRRGMGRGLMTDPHFATPQMDASGKPDLYAGWASNQAQQFGELPYDIFANQVNDINRPEFNSMGAGAGNMVKNQAPATWNGGNPGPWTPSSTPAWGANWGQGAQKGGLVGSPGGAAQQYGFNQNNNGPSFGASPWGNSAWNNSWGTNPWGMQ